MQDGVLNLCRVKLRDQQRLERTGVMKEYPQYPNGKFGDAVPRAANARAGASRDPSSNASGWETDPNAYLYFICPGAGVEGDLQGHRQGRLDHRSRFRHAERAPAAAQGGVRRDRAVDATKTKFEAMELLNEHDIPCGPILSMKELAHEPSLRATGTIVEVDHPKRGKYLTVGNPIKLSDSVTEVTALAAAG